MTSAIFSAIGDVVKLITTWVGIALDWTNEVKELSDNALDELQQEREIDLQIAKQKLQKRLEEKKYC